MLKTITKILFVTFLFLAGVSYAVEPKKTKIVFRYDDYSSRSPTDFEIKLINVFRKYDTSFTVGIIPYIVSSDIQDPSPQEVMQLSDEKVNILKTAIASGIVEPALHGYSHQTNRNRKWILDNYSELSGLSYEEQLMKIKKGKDFLENEFCKKVDIFIPPWNSYDKNTLRCLEKLNFSYLSADFGGISDKTIHIKFLPATTDIYGLHKSINSARSSSCQLSVIVVIFHSYNFIDVDKKIGKITLKQFCKLLSWITSQKDVQVCSMNEIFNKNTFGKTTFLKNKMYFKIQRLIPPLVLIFLNLNRNGIYLCSDYLTKVQIKIWAVLICYGLFIVVISSYCFFKVGSLLFSRFYFFKIFFCLGTFVLLILLSLYIFKDSSISYKGLTALLIVLGVFIACFKLRGKMSPEIKKSHIIKFRRHN